jgi:hypothetical protein
MACSDFRPGEVVVIAAFDDVPEHLFQIESVEDDCVTGFALTGPLEGAYGEPALDLVIGRPRPALG